MGNYLKDFPKVRKASESHMSAEAVIALSKREAGRWSEEKEVKPASDSVHRAVGTDAQLSEEDRA